MASLFGMFRRSFVHSQTVSQRGLRYHPALKHSLVFAAGIALAHLANVPPDALLAPVFFSLLWIVAAALRPSLFLPFAVVVTVALSGALWYAVRAGTDLPRIGGSDHENVELVGVVASDPVAKDGRMEWRMEPDSLLYRNSSARLSGPVIVRLYDSTARPADVPGYGARISLKGTFRLPSGPRFPGEFDYGGRLAAQGVAGTFDCYRRTEIFAFGQKREGYAEEVVRSVRAWVRRFARERVGGEEGDVLTALMLGDRGEIDRSTRDAFARTGTAHVLAVSGLHVGLIALALFVCVSWLRSRPLRFALFTGALGAYVVLVGAPPSVLRASVMAVVFLLAYEVGRLSRPLNTFGVAALVLLLLEPAWLFDVGFQLSFAAVAGILLLYGPLYRRLSVRFPRSMGNILTGRAAQLLLLSFSAQLFTFPLTLYYFGYVSPFSPFINILVVPLTTLGLGAGLAGTLFSVLPGLPEWFGGAAHLALRSALGFVEWSASFRGGTAYLHLTSPAVVLPALVGLLYLSFSRSAGQSLVRGFSFLLLLFVLFVLDRRFDPLADSGSGYLYVMPLSRGGGIVAGIHCGDSLLLCYGGLNARDSAAAARAGELLAQRIGAGHVRVADLAVPYASVAAGSDSSAKDSDLRLMNRAGPEYLHRRVPVIFSNTGRRSPGFVAAGGRVLVQIPLQRKFGRAVVLAPDSFRQIVWWE